MLGDKQRAGVLMAEISDQEFNDIQEMLDDADGHFNTNNQVAAMLRDAHSNSSRFVDLVEEGWHQLEDYKGKKWLHVTLYHQGLKYHCYAAVSGANDIPAPETHVISTISYINFGGSRNAPPINVSRTG